MRWGWWVLISAALIVVIILSIRIYTKHQKDVKSLNHPSNIDKSIDKVKSLGPYGYTLGNDEPA